MVRGSWLPDDAKRAGKQALSEAKWANGLRDRVVHDLWVHAMDAEFGGQPFERLKPGKAAPTVELTPGDLADVNETLEQLRRASARMVALSLAVVYGLTGPLPIQGFGSVEELLPEIRGE